jgi:hypothetical protein
MAFECGHALAGDHPPQADRLISTAGHLPFAVPGKGQRKDQVRMTPQSPALFRGSQVPEFDFSRSPLDGLLIKRTTRRGERIAVWREGDLADLLGMTSERRLFWPVAVCQMRIVPL